MEEYTTHYSLNRLGQGHPNHAYTSDMDALDEILNGHENSLGDHDTTLSEHETWLLGHDDDIATLDSDLSTLRSDHDTLASDFTTHTGNNSAHHIRYSDAEAQSAVEVSHIIPADTDFDLGGNFIWENGSNPLKMRSTNNTEDQSLSHRLWSQNGTTEGYFGIKTKGGLQTADSYTYFTTDRSFESNYFLRGGYNGNVEVRNDLEASTIYEANDRVATRPWTTANFNDYTDSEAIAAVEGATLSGPLTFEDTLGPKTNYYTDGYGVGIDSSTLVLYGSSFIDFRNGGYNGSVGATIDTSDGSMTLGGNQVVTTDNTSGYELQKNGTDGAGIINFKT